MSSRRVSYYLWMVVLPLGIIGGIILVNARQDSTFQVGSPGKSGSTALAPAVTPPKPIPDPPPVVEGSFIGTLIAHESVDIAANFEGRLDSVYVGLGDSVKTGALIARLDPKALQQELNVLEATHRAAQSEQHKAELELTDAQERSARRVILVEDGVLSKEEMITSKRQVEIAKANVEATKAHVTEQEALLAQLKEKLSNTEIRSPYDGIVSARQRNPGAVITRGEPIVSITKSDDLWVRFAVPFEKAGTLAVGTALTVNLESLHLSIPGTVENVSPRTDAALQMVIVEARLQVPSTAKKLIKPGLVGQVRLNIT